jgi:SAM-dependent methyltransferase
MHKKAKRQPPEQLSDSFGQGIAAQGFGRDYWISNYSTPKEMDTIGNARDHARYLQFLFRLDQIDINSVIDFGHGTGHLLANIVKVFKPYEVLGMEPSAWAFEQSAKRVLPASPNMRLKLIKCDILSWCRKSHPGAKFYDLGICTSVLQYLSDHEIQEALPIIAQRVKYLYLTVPTENEYRRLWKETKFKDDYALRRTKAQYQELLQKDFTFVSNRLLESKTSFHEHNTNFRELLFRF